MGGNVNNARLLSPEIHSNFVKQFEKEKPFLVLILDGHLRGQVTDMLKWVLRQLWNQLCLPVNSFLTQLELEKIPMIDKAGLAILGNDSFLLES